MHIPERHVEHAFDILKDSDHAKARAAHEHAEKHLKVVLAECLLNADGKTVGEREAQALASEKYRLALNDFRLVAEVYYTARDRREAAAAIIEAWRTQQSDLRAMARAA